MAVKKAASKPAQRPAQRSEQRRIVPRPPKDGYVKDKGDKYFVDEATKPEGWVYQWSALSIMGKENRSGMLRDKRNEWTPVPSERHPELSSDSTDGSIVQDGLILMERPVEVQAFFDIEAEKEARKQVGDQFRRLQLVPEGTLNQNPSKRDRVEVVRGKDLSIPEDAE